MIKFKGEKELENLRREMEAVKRLGDQIGYGNMIACAEALWNEMLDTKRFEIENTIYAEIARELS